MKKLLFTFTSLFILVCSCSQRPVAEHVIFIGLDGWASYTFDEAEMPNAKAMMDAGCYTFQKRTALPSSSAINWASMFMGAGPELHGYTKWGSKTPELPSRIILKNNIFPTIFQVYRDACPKAEIGVLADWDGIMYLVDTLSLSHHALSGDYKADPSLLCAKAEQYIKGKKPNLLAICFDNPDHVGHAKGWDSAEYHEMMRELDSYIGRIVEATKAAGIYDKTVFILTSDHGGKEKKHGSISMQEMETPFIICGKGIRKGGEFSESMMQYDVAATIARILGIPQKDIPQVWIGRPMVQVLK